MEKQRFVPVLTLVVLVGVFSMLTPSGSIVAGTDPELVKQDKTMPATEAKAFKPAGETVKIDTSSSVTPEEKQTIGGILGATPDRAEQKDFWTTTAIPPSSGYSVYYYDKDGNFIGKKVIVNNNNGQNSETWFGKDNKELKINPDHTIPVSRPLTPDEQANYKTIFGATPVTVKEIMLCGGTTRYFYDKDGNLIGSMHQTTGTQYPQPATFYDKNGKQIDVASILVRLSPEAAAKILKALDPTTAAYILFATKPCVGTTGNSFIEGKTNVFSNQQIAAILGAMDAKDAAAIITALFSAVDEPSIERTARQDRAVVVLASMDANKAARIIASDKISGEVAAKILASSKMKIETAVGILKLVETTKARTILTALDKINPDKAKTIRDQMNMPNPPARPGDTETNPAVWQKYYADYVKYINSLTDMTQRKQAWETLAKDIFQLSQTHPERITAAAIGTVMLNLTNELKEKYRNPDYKLDISTAQKLIVDAALNLVKSDAFWKMDDASQIAVGHYFYVLSVELSWRSAFNDANKDLYPKIADFFKTLLEKGSTTVKAQAFRQVVTLWIIDRWGSVEGNHAVADQILKQALDIKGGLQGLVDEWMSNIDNSSLSGDNRVLIANALSAVIWQQDNIKQVIGSMISDAGLAEMARKLTTFIKGVNDGSIAINGASRTDLVNATGCALVTLLNKSKLDISENKALSEVFITLAHDSLLLPADKGGSVWMQSVTINILTAVVNTAKARQNDELARKCVDVLLDPGFDLAGYIAKARNEMSASKNADYAAYVGTALANIEKVNLENAAGKINAANIQDTIATIKAWLSEPKHIKDMRNMDWLKGLYAALTGLLDQVYKKGSTLGDDKTLQDNIVAIFSTLSGVNDTLVKELAGKDLEGMITNLKTNGFKELACRLEMLSCPDSKSLMAKAWEYFTAKDYGSSKLFATETITRYGEEALKQQASLKDFAPAGKESDYWALNDVGTAHFILGQIFTAQGDKTQAKAEFNTVIGKFGFAQSWDAKGWYWKVAETAKTELAKL